MTKYFKLRQQCYKERSLRRVVAENVLRATTAARKLLEQVQDPSSWLWQNTGTHHFVEDKRNCILSFAPLENHEAGKVISISCANYP